VNEHDQIRDGDPATRLLRETLRERADALEAPAVIPVPARGHAPGGWLLAAAAATVAVLAVGGVATWRADGPVPLAAEPSTAATRPVSSATAPSPPAPRPVRIPAGWKPVSSLGVEIHVPPSWRVGGGGPTCHPRKPADGVISLPVGAVLAMGWPPCPPSRGTRVAFAPIRPDSAVAERRTGDGRTEISWVSPERTTAVYVSGSDTALLRQVVDTARPVDVDSLGCSTTPPEFDWDRPRPGLPPVRLPTDVVEVVGCLYAVPHGTRERRLVHSASMSREQRTALTAALRRAPAAPTPRLPGCRPPQRSDQDYAVLRVRTGAGATTLTVRWAGCLERYVASEQSLSGMTVKVWSAATAVFVAENWGPSDLPAG